MPALSSVDTGISSANRVRSSSGPVLERDRRNDFFLPSNRSTPVCLAILLFLAHCCLIGDCRGDPPSRDGVPENVVPGNPSADPNSPGNETPGTEAPGTAAPGSGVPGNAADLSEKSETENAAANRRDRLSGDESDPNHGTNSQAADRGAATQPTENLPPVAAEITPAELRQLWSKRQSGLKSARIWFRVATCRSDDPSFALPDDVPAIDHMPMEGPPADSLPADSLPADAVPADLPPPRDTGRFLFSDVSRICVHAECISYRYAPISTGIREAEGSLGLASWNGREFVAIDPDLLPLRARVMAEPSPAAFADFGVWPLLHAIRPIDSPCPLPFLTDAAKTIPGRFTVSGMECHLLELPTDRTTLQKLWVSCSQDKRIIQVEFWARSRSGSYGTSPGMRITVVDWHPLTPAGTAIPRRWHTEQLAFGKVLYRFVGLSYLVKLNEPIDSAEFTHLPLPVGTLVADFRSRDSRGPERYIQAGDGHRKPLISDISTLLQPHPDDIEPPPAQPLPDARPLVVIVLVFIIGLHIFGWWKFRGTN